jgi:hypothetical protein
LDTARQILRYSIPGSVLILAVLLAQSTLRTFWGAPVAATLQMGGAGSIVAVLASSIPIGFLLYQIYYSGYQPIRRFGRVPTLDRGAVVLKELSCRQRRYLSERYGVSLDPRPATEPQPSGGTRTVRVLIAQVMSKLGLEPLQLVDWRERPCPSSGQEDCHCLAARSDLGIRMGESSRAEEVNDASRELDEAYAERWHRNWNVIMSLLTDGEYSEIKHEYTSLSDIYHALGAARTALVTAIIAILGYNAVRYGHQVVDNPIRTLIGGVLVLGTCLALVKRIHSARRQTEVALLTRLALSLRASVPLAPSAH